MTRPPSPARQALVSALRRQVEKLEGVRPPEDAQLLSTGVEALDRLLPGGGLRRGSLVEYLTPGPGSGAGTLALSAVREACREGGAFVVVDRASQKGSGTFGGKRSSIVKTPDPLGLRQRRFYPPAAAAWGIDLARMLLLRPASEPDALWALDQALRCPGVAAVWAEWDWLDVRDFRRLQLAAESGRTLGILLRPARLRGQPTWAEVQWEVRRAKDEGRSEGRKTNKDERQSQPIRPSSFVLRPFSWRLMVELVRCRGAAGGQSVQLELEESAGIWREATDHATYPLHLPAELADPTPARRA